MSKKVQKYSKESIKSLILSNPEFWVPRAITTLYEYQTYFEQYTESTNNTNGVGFNKPDAHKMTYYAKWLNSGKKLSGRFFEDAKERVLKYSGQLAKIANEKYEEKLGLAS